MPHANLSAAPAGRLPLFAAPPAKGEFSIVLGSMVTHSYIVRGRGNPESFHSCNRHDARHHARRVHPWGAGALRPLLAASRWTRRDGPLRRAGGVPAYPTRAHRAAQPLRLHPRGAIAGPEGPGASPGRRRCRDRTRRRGGRQVDRRRPRVPRVDANCRSRHVVHAAHFTGGCALAIRTARRGVDDTDSASGWALGVAGDGGTTGR